MLAENARFEQAGGMAVGCIDVQKLMAERRKNTSFHDNALELHITPPLVVEGAEPDLSEGQVDRRWGPGALCPEGPGADGAALPGDPRDPGGRAGQAALPHRRQAGGRRDFRRAGLDAGADRRGGGDAAHRQKAVGCAGGDDAGVRTTGRTYENACGLTRALGAELKEVDIRPACIQHMKDIGQDPEVHDVTYENTQARQRTYILMDLATRKAGF